MGIGPKIKEYRNKAGLTQKDLADKLFVTYQAVSRWENDDAEPSFDTLKELCRILNCSTDELFGLEKDSDAEERKEQTKVIEKVIVQEHKPVLAVCEDCNRPIFEPSEIKRVDATSIVGFGEHAHTECRQKVLCAECDERRIAEEKEAKERNVRERDKEKADRLRKRRIHSFVWPSLCTLVFWIFGIVSFTKGETSTGRRLLVTGLLAYTFIATMILCNTFIPELWVEITSWGFVKLPGIIFEFSLDGCLFLIGMKILFFILGISLALSAGAFATVVAMILSPFVYPFALGKNLRGIED